MELCLGSGSVRSTWARGQVANRRISLGLRTRTHRSIPGQQLQISLHKLVWEKDNNFWRLSRSRCHGRLCSAWALSTTSSSLHLKRSFISNTTLKLFHHGLQKNGLDSYVSATHIRWRSMCRTVMFSCIAAIWRMREQSKILRRPWRGYTAYHTR